MNRPTPETDAACPYCGTESYGHDEKDYWKCGTIRYEEKFVVRTDLCNEREARKAAESKLAEAREWQNVKVTAAKSFQLRELSRFKKVHDAASRLLVAINKQLPISCFLLVSSEYYRLKNAIYGREQTK